MGVTIRNARPEDVAKIKELERACYPTLSDHNGWKIHHLESHQRNFPEGQFVAEDNGQIVGYCANFITRSDLVFRPHRFRDVTARGTFDSHDPDGDVLYGAEIMVHPGHRRRGVGKKFYNTRFDLIRRRGLRFFAAGGRLPQYGKVADKVSAEQYVKEVLDGRRSDRVLSAQMRSGLTVRGVLPDYLDDPSSRSWATLLVWENPEFASTQGGDLPWVAGTH